MEGLQKISAGTKIVDNYRKAVRMDDNVLIRTSLQSRPVEEFARDVVEGMACRPRKLSCRFLYDAHGSKLYERITEQPEYYQTRTEASILKRTARHIRQLTGPLTILELGSGSSAKTSYLLDAYLRRADEQRYVPVDVSETALEQATDDLERKHSGVQVVGLHGTYEMAMRVLETASPAMVVFLGSTIGNFDKTQEDEFWSSMADSLAGGDFFLLGVDLIKDRQLLHDAYNDAAGVTAHFTTNLFARMNRELGADLDIANIEHEARWSEENQQMEIRCCFKTAQTIRVAPLDQSFDIEPGEKILLEVSRKFRLEERTTYLEQFGFQVRESFTDEKGWFGLMLLQRSEDESHP